MKDTALYQQLLGIESPWRVSSVDLSIAQKRVVVEVELKPQVWADPSDPTRRAHINGWTDRQWRHLDSCGFETLIRARVPQLKYASGRVEELAVAWAERYARITRAMEGFVLALLAACPSMKRVCELTGLDWHTVNKVMLRGVERGIKRRAAEPIVNLGIDEKATERGHSYATILSDCDRSRVLDVVPGRKLESAEQILGTLTPEQRHGVKAIAMDMWPAYMSAAKRLLDNAEIVHDKFHVAKYLNEAVDAVRKQEHRELMQARGESVLSGSKWAWMKGYPDRRSSEAVAFRELKTMNLATSRAWAYKDSFAKFWDYHSRRGAKHYFDAWGKSVMRSRLEPLKKVVRMMRRHEAGLTSYAVHRITNACAEGFNSAIQLIKANARGFRNFDNYRARILFHCGRLDVGVLSKMAR